jgi:hypothetical protein
VNAKVHRALNGKRRCLKPGRDGVARERHHGPKQCEDEDQRSIEPS